MVTEFRAIAYPGQFPILIPICCRRLGIKQFQGLEDFAGTVAIGEQGIPPAGFAVVHLGDGGGEGLAAAGGFAFLDGVHRQQQLIGAVFVDRVVFARGKVVGPGAEPLAGVLVEDLGEGGPSDVAVAAGEGEDAAAGAVFTAAGLGDDDAGRAGGGLVQI